MRCYESSIDLLEVIAHADEFCGNGTVLKTAIEMVDFHHYDWVISLDECSRAVQNLILGTFRVHLEEVDPSCSSQYDVV